MSAPTYTDSHGLIYTDTHAVDGGTETRTGDDIRAWFPDYYNRKILVLTYNNLQLWDMDGGGKDSNILSDSKEEYINIFANFDAQEFIYFDSNGNVKFINYSGTDITPTITSTTDEYGRPLLTYTGAVSWQYDGTLYMFGIVHTYDYPATVSNIHSRTYKIYALTSSGIGSVIANVGQGRFSDTFSAGSLGWMGDIPDNNSYVTVNSRAPWTQFRSRLHNNPYYFLNGKKYYLQQQRYYSGGVLYYRWQLVDDSNNVIINGTPSTNAASTQLSPTAPGNTLSVFLHDNNVLRWVRPSGCTSTILKTNPSGYIPVFSGSFRGVENNKTPIHNQNGYEDYLLPGGIDYVGAFKSYVHNTYSDHTRFLLSENVAADFSYGTMGTTQATVTELVSPIPTPSKAQRSFHYFSPDGYVYYDHKTGGVDTITRVRLSTGNSEDIFP